MAAPELAGRIVDMAGGTIGEMSTLLNAAAIHAIQSGEERITVTTLERCDYTPPGLRKQAATLM
ncbi:Bacterial TniB protein [compost metagenome]